MSLATLSELKAAGVTGADGVLLDRLAGVSAMIERYCNRRFARRVSSRSVTSGTVTLEIPRHGLQAGAVVDVSTPVGGTDIDGEFTVSSVTLNEIVITADVTDDEIEGLELSVRPHVTVIKSTTGEHSLLLDPRPIERVESLSYADGAGGWIAYTATDYVLADVHEGYSISGEVALQRSRFPGRSDRPYYNGVKVVFVAGENAVPSDIVQAAIDATKLIPKRRKQGGKQSERYDYYSYAKMAPGELVKTFGEIENVLNHYRIPVI